MSHLDRLESMKPVVHIERDGVQQEHRSTSEVHDGDGDGDGGGHAVCLEVDVLVAVRPQQVWSQQSEPAGSNRGGGATTSSTTDTRLVVLLLLVRVKQVNCTCKTHFTTIDSCFNLL